MTPFRAGATVRVVDLTDLRLPGKQKPPFEVGDLLQVTRCTTTGLVMVDRHQGLFRPHRFAPV
ncbi:MAG: hypothetical protein IIZ63_12295 [Caulobacteraceae bacterium]|nr:hypothetical protein [Caulobacteraceae bacterium]